MHHMGTTQPFLGPDGEVAANSIAEIKYLSLGGLDQWVMIRGENIANPLLILLHGGPGFSEMRLFRTHNAALEKHFTVVYWDQRGAGKSFDPAIPLATMTVEQFIADLDALVDAACARTGRPKVTIFGHSWGSVLGPLYAARFPAKVAAYVGSRQIGDWRASLPPMNGHSRKPSFAIVLLNDGFVPTLVFRRACWHCERTAASRIIDFAGKRPKLRRLAGGSVS